MIDAAASALLGSAPATDSMATLLKTILILLLFVSSFAGGGCSRSDNAAPAKASPTPNLRSDAERLQQAINKAAEQRKQQSPASPSPAAP